MEKNSSEPSAVVGEVTPRESDPVTSVIANAAANIIESTQSGDKPSQNAAQVMRFNVKEMKGGEVVGQKGDTTEIEVEGGKFVENVSRGANSSSSPTSDRDSPKEAPPPLASKQLSVIEINGESCNNTSLVGNQGNTRKIKVGKGGEYHEIVKK